MYIITPTIGDMVVERNQTIFNMTGYIFLAVGLAIHFIAGTIGGTSTLFIVGVGVEERKRTDSVLVFLLRNLIQVVATAAIVYFVTPVLTLHHFFADFAITDIVAFALQVVAVILIVVLIKHAMGTIEYNLMGMDAFGIQRTAVFALLTGLVCVGAFILDKTGHMPESVVDAIYPILPEAIQNIFH